MIMAFAHMTELITLPDLKKTIFRFIGRAITRGGAVALFAVMAAMFLVWQALSNAPTSDESAHLVSGIATVRTGDPGFYRVNPPLHKLLSGLAVEVIFSPEIPNLYPASLFGSGSRHEFDLAEDFLTEHREDYARFFYVGRLVRLPIILLAAGLLFYGMPRSLRSSAAIATVLWLTSPMTLGHGWAGMPDALSACAMILLLVMTVDWLESRTSLSFLTLGVAWGLAIGTKFTFCPLYLLWPFGMIWYQWVRGNATMKSLVQVILGHLGQGVLALVVVIGLYNASDLGVPLENHAFRSERMIALTENMGSIRSPFPEQFLIGIDEQQLDLERGYPTYFGGTWYPEGIWWYYLVGVVAKEQVVFSIGLVLALIGGWKLWTSQESNCHSSSSTDSARNQQERRACFVLCAFATIAVIGILSLHSQMALNIRYAFPALVPLYLLIGIGATILMETYRRFMRTTFIVLTAIILLEVGWTFPHYFAYANPMFGGSYRVPSVLHDSNFDGAQDLWRLEKWLAENPTPPSRHRYVMVHTHVPEVALRLTPRIAPNAVIEQMIAERNGETSNHVNAEIVVMRGLGVPAPWTRMSGQPYPEIPDALIRLLAMPPDEFITPTLVVYRD